jgi:Ca-activated chloride channel homolog
VVAARDLRRSRPPAATARMNSHFEFQYPWLLGLLALLPVYAFLRGRAGKHSAVRFSSAEIARAVGATARSAAGRLLPFLRLLVAALLIVALAGPRFANDRTETQTSGVDIMLVLDLSWSMMALDMSGPGERVTRFDIASGVLEDFIRKRPTDRIGLVVFSAVPYLASPLTLNHDWLIENLRQRHVGIIRELGTAIGDATASAAKHLKSARDSKSRLIILLTDGDNNKGEIDPVPAAQLAAALGAKVYTIGIGVEAPCHLPEFEPATGKLRLDPNGNVIPRIILQPANYSLLGKMSALSNAKSYRAKNRRELQSIYNEIDRLEKTEIKLRRFTMYTPLFPWPLLTAFALFALELGLANTRYRRVP